MNKILVIAGTHGQAMDWMRRNAAERWIADQTASLSDYTIVDHPRQIMGLRDPHGVFVGTWRERPNILEIVEELMLATINANGSLNRVYTQVKMHPKPKPKLIPVKGGWVGVP
jgi:hypothetical protein